MRRECRKLHSSGVEEPIGGDEQGVGTIDCNSGERSLDVRVGTGVEDPNFKPDCAGSFGDMLGRKRIFLLGVAVFGLLPELAGEIGDEDSS